MLDRLKSGALVLSILLGSLLLTACGTETTSTSENVNKLVDIEVCQF